MYVACFEEWAVMSQALNAISPLGHSIAIPLAVDVEKSIILMERAIRRATSDRVHQLNVTIAADSVTLRGRCATYHCKQLAQTAAAKMASGKTLQNQIEVW
jgi:hypothetical protein